MFRIDEGDIRAQGMRESQSGVGFAAPCWPRDPHSQEGSFLGCFHKLHFYLLTPCLIR